MSVTALLEQVRANWQERCKSADKELVVITEPGCPLAILTDVELVQQILGNLVDNACKYSRGAADGRIWLRARPGGGRWLRSRSRTAGPVSPSESNAAYSEHFAVGGRLMSRLVASASAWHCAPLDPTPWRQAAAQAGSRLRRSVFSVTAEDMKGSSEPRSGEII